MCRLRRLGQDHPPATKATSSPATRVRIASMLTSQVDYGVLHVPPRGRCTETASWRAQRGRRPRPRTAHPAFHPLRWPPPAAITAEIRRAANRAIAPHRCYDRSFLVLVRARMALHPVCFHGDVEREPRIVPIEHRVGNVLDNLAEKKADARTEIPPGVHREVTIPMAREQLGHAGRREAPVVAIWVGRAHTADRARWPTARPAAAARDGSSRDTVRVASGGEASA